MFQLNLWEDCSGSSPHANLNKLIFFFLDNRYNAHKNVIILCALL